MHTQPPDRTAVHQLALVAQCIALEGGIAPTLASLRAAPKAAPERPILGAMQRGRAHALALADDGRVEGGVIVLRDERETHARATMAPAPTPRTRYM